MKPIQSRGRAGGLLLALCCALCCCVPKMAQAEPLSAVLVPMEGYGWNDVEDEAWWEANTDTPQYSNANPNVPNYKTFEGDYEALPGSGDTTRLAIFSDDGCRVTINGQVVHDRLNTGQALPDLSRSLYGLPTVLQEGLTYHIKVEYSQTSYQGTTDIDGASLFVWTDGDTDGDDAAPQAPTLSVKGPVTETVVPLTWTQNTDEGFAGYELYRSNTPNFAIEGATSVADFWWQDDTTYNDSGLTPGTTYYYKLAVYDWGGQMALSNEVAATTLPDGPPSAVTLSITDDISSYTQVKLAWTKNTEADFKRYELHRSLTSGFTPTAATLLTTFDSSNQTQHTDTGIKDDIYYYYRIVAVDKAEHKTVSNEVKVDLPPLPVKLTVEWVDAD